MARKRRSKKQDNVDAWMKRFSDHIKKALENASRYFDDDDVLTVHLLEALYGQESSFGQFLRQRGMSGAAGHTHMDKQTAERYGLLVGKNNDERFDVDKALNATAHYLKDIDNRFSKDFHLIGSIYTIAVLDELERRNFVLAAHNAGESRIAKAQQLAQKDGKDPTSWKTVQDYLKAAGASDAKVKEIIQYVEKIKQYETEFSQKSDSRENYKDKDPKPEEPIGTALDGHWITKDGNHILIEN